MSVITVPKILREKLGEDGADSLVELINKSEEKGKEDTLEFVEEKFEKRLMSEVSKINERITFVEEKLEKRLMSEVSKINERITSEVSKINERITLEVSKINDRITSEVLGAKAEIIKWMFIFWIGQIGVILGMLFAFFKR